jgi:hypothetical protein
MKNERINQLISEFVRGRYETDFCNDHDAMCDVATVALDERQKELFARHLEKVFLRDNPQWQGPEMFMALEALPRQLAEAFVQATGMWEEYANVWDGGMPSESSRLSHGR